MEEDAVLRQRMPEVPQRLSNELQRCELQSVVDQELPVIHVLALRPDLDCQFIEARDSRTGGPQIEELEVGVHGFLCDLGNVDRLILPIYVQGEEGVGHATSCNILKLLLACQWTGVGPFERRAAAHAFGGPGGSRGRGRLVDAAMVEAVLAIDALKVARGARVRQGLGLAQGQGFGGRLEGARERIVVNCLAARSRGAEREGQVADGNALEMSQLAILPKVSNRRCNGHETYIRQQPGPLARRRWELRRRVLGHGGSNLGHRGAHPPCIDASARVRAVCAGGRGAGMAGRSERCLRLLEG